MNTVPIISGDNPNVKRVYVVNNAFSPEEIKRHFLIEIAAKTDSPSDIASKVEILSIEEKRVLTIALNSSIRSEVNYMSGAHYEKKYLDSNNNVQTKIVTDWTPATATVNNTNVNGISQFFDVEHFSVYNSSVDWVSDHEELIDIDPAQYEEARKNAALRCEMENISLVHGNRDRTLAGDEIKDVHISSTETTIINEVIYSLPMFDIKYKYGEKEYHTDCFAFKHVSKEDYIPSIYLENAPISEKSPEDLLKEWAVPVRKKRNTAWIACGALLVVGIIISAITQLTFLWYLFAAAAIAGFIYHLIISNKKYNAKKVEVNSEASKVRFADICKRLQDEKMAELSETEKLFFDTQDAGKPLGMIEGTKRLNLHANTIVGEITGPASGLEKGAATVQILDGKLIVWIVGKPDIELSPKTVRNCSLVGNNIQIELNNGRTGTINCTNSIANGNPHLKDRALSIMKG